MARGSITPHTAKDGTVSYRVRVDLGINPVTGKRQQPLKTCRTKRAAEALLRKWLAEIDAGTFQQPNPQTVAELLQVWLETRIAVGHKHTSYMACEVTARVHLAPALGHIPVQKLTALHIEDFYAAKIAAGASDHMIRQCKIRLAQALDVAVRHNLVARNEARIAELPARRKQPAPKQVRSWTRDQAHAFLAVAEDSKYGPLWVLMLHTGLRIAEALGLRWSDIDLDGRRLQVEQQVMRPPKGGGTSPLDVPKTPRGTREVRLSPVLVALLRTHKAQEALRQRQAAAPWPDVNLVFTRADGRRIPSYMPRRELDVLIARVGLPRLSSHGLRRTFVTLSLRRGVPLSTVSRLVGHSKTTITQDVYQDVTRDVLEEGWDMIDGLYESPKEPPDLPVL